MESRKSNSFIWLAVGSAVGALACHFLHTEKGKVMKKEIIGAVANIVGRTEDIAETIKGKMMKAGVKTVDKVADATSEVADKADMLKNKVHTAALSGKNKS